VTTKLRIWLITLLITFVLLIVGFAYVMKLAIDGEVSLPHT
jgi:hypothetical protein